MLFGKPDSSEPPGLHFGPPYPVEEKAPAQGDPPEHHLEVGTALSEGNSCGSPLVLRRPAEEGSLMLNGGENIVEYPSFVVYWRIKDAQQYLFNIQNPEITVKEVAEKAPCAAHCRPIPHEPLTLN